MDGVVGVMHSQMEPGAVEGGLGTIWGEIGGFWRIVGQVRASSMGCDGLRWDGSGGSM